MCQLVPVSSFRQISERNSLMPRWSRVHCHWSSKLERISAANQICMVKHNLVARHDADVPMFGVCQSMAMLKQIGKIPSFRASNASRGPVDTRFSLQASACDACELQKPKPLGPNCATCAAVKVSSSLGIWDLTICL